MKVLVNLILKLGSFTYGVCGMEQIYSRLSAATLLKDMM
jgi:hypothetical protein